MYKLKTNFAYFRFNSTNQQGTISVTWYKLQSGDFDEEGVCFSYGELQTFQNFISQNPLNFPGDKNYEPCNDEGDGIFCPVEDFEKKRVPNFPENVIIRKIPLLLDDGYFHSCADVILTTPQDNDNSSYNLPFDVIGHCNI